MVNVYEKPEQPADAPDSGEQDERTTTEQTQPAEQPQRGDDAGQQSAR